MKIVSKAPPPAGSVKRPGTPISLLGVLLLSLAASASGVTLVRDGKASLSIYVSPEDLQPVSVKVRKSTVSKPNALSEALEDFNYHLSTMSGARLEVIAEGDPVKVPDSAMVVGRLAEKLGAAPAKSKWGEGYRLKAQGNRLMIAGETLSGATYGIYEMLNRLGCDWVMPGKIGEVIPARKTVTLEDMDQSRTPDFALRWTWIGGGAKYVDPKQSEEFALWRKRQRLGYAHELRMRINEPHMWQFLQKNYPEEFEKDPSLHALVRLPDGTHERKGPQIETTHPKAVELVCRFIRARFEKEGWAKTEPATIGIGPADGLDFSDSPESIAARSNRIDPLLGVPDATDLVVKLANEVLDAIGDEFPNLKLGFYVYSAHEDYPARYVPNPRIAPIFAPINYSRLHSTCDPRSKTRAHYRSVVEQWANLAGKQGNRLMVYEYNWNLADNLLPFTRVQTIAEDLRYYRDLGTVGFNLQAIRAWAINAPHDYIFARMAWDASLDWKKLLADFCRFAYGPAAAEMERYYLRLAARQQEAGQEAGGFYSAPLVFDERFIAESRADLDSAFGKNDLSAEERARIEGARYGFDNLAIYLDWNAAINRFDFSGAVERIDAMRANFDKALAANSGFFDYSGGMYLKKFLEAPTREAATYSAAPYRIVQPLPDELSTAFDPTGSGNRLNLYGPQINDQGWIKTRTYSSTWDAQGLGFLREGTVWYRSRVQIPAVKEGEGIGLFLMGFEDEAVVWLNGKPIGSSGIKFGRPAVFDLTEAVIPGGENVLAIAVKRNSMANEIGLGGILRPGFIFEGPRIVPTVPATPKFQERVLPGGDVEIIKNPKASSPRSR